MVHWLKSEPLYGLLCQHPHSAALRVERQTKWLNGSMAVGTKYLETSSLEPVSSSPLVWWSQTCSCLSTHTLKHSRLIFLHWWFSPRLLCFISPLQRQAKYSENKLKCTKARNDYLLNLAATNAVVAKYYIHDVSDMIDVSMYYAHVFVYFSQLGFLMFI